MARKRKAPSSQQTHQPQPKPKPVVIEEVVEEEEETSDEEEEEEIEEIEVEEDEEEEEEESESESDESESESEEEEDSESSSSSDEEPNDDVSKKQTLTKLLSPFTKSQIIDLLKQASTSDPTLLPKITHFADVDPTHRNLFVRGLGWDATPDLLLHAFSPFGDIEDSKLVLDKSTGRAKGYAFVLFKTRAAAKKALKSPLKKIGSRMVSCQLAALGRPLSAAPGGAVDSGPRKVYVGNVGPHMSAERLRAFFGRFGEVEDGPSEEETEGYAVITYKSAEGFWKAMEEPIKVFENCQLHCKKFVENHNMSNAVGGGAVNVSANPSVADVGYGSLGVNNAGMMGANLNASGGYLMPHNPGIGLPGNAMLAAGYNPGFGGGNYGMGASVMGNYGSQAALHGLGAFQNVQMGQSSIGTAGTATTTTRGPSSGLSAPTTFPSYFGR